MTPRPRSLAYRNLAFALQCLAVFAAMAAMLLTVLAAGALLAPVQ
jgi:hypothetical protein